MSCINELDRPNPPTTIQDLEQVLLQEWNNIPQDIINKLINSLTRRFQAGIETNGGHIRNLSSIIPTFYGQREAVIFFLTFQYNNMRHV